MIGTSETVTFISPVPQTYPITVDVTDLNGNHYSKSVTLTSHNPKQPYSPYISQVIDYHPAPGQFVNSLPRYEEGDTQETMNLKVLNMEITRSTETEKHNACALFTLQLNKKCGVERVLAGVHATEGVISVEEL